MIATDRIIVNSTTVPVDLVTNPKASGKIDRSDDFAALWVTVKNRTNTAALLLGSTGGQPDQTKWFEWEVADGPLTLPLEPGETLQALLVGAGNQTVHVIRGGR